MITRLCRPSILPLLLAVLFLLPGTGAAAELRASVDRTVVSENETLSLTVRLSEQAGFSSPDFRALEQDFDILSQQRSSQFRSVNGRTEAYTEWTLTLGPKTSGTLRIPSFSFQGTTSNPLEISVREAPSGSAAGQQPLFVEVEADKFEPHVQEQVLVTVRIHTGIMLRDASMEEELKVDNAVVERVAETAYTREENGRMYRVIELVYAIYPQHSGPLTIPSLTWNVVMATDRGSGLRYRFQTPGEMRRLRSEPIHLNVKPRPSHFSGKDWLPAKEVEVEEHWSSDPSRFVVGEPLTRTITLRADGLTSAQLPALPEQKIDGLRFYSDQPQYDDIRSSQGIVGHRTESVAMVPSQPGKLTLPEMEIHWWDTTTQQARIARLPARELSIAPGANSNVAAPLTPAAEPSSVADDESEVSAATRGSLSWLWLLSNVFFAALAIIFMTAWLRARAQTHPQKQTAIAEPALQSDGAFHVIRRACSDNDPRAARQALGAWGRLYWQLPHVPSAQEISLRADYPPLAKELAELDKILYGSHQPASWQGDHLWRTLVKFKRLENKKRREQENRNSKDLPPLYPTPH